MEKRTDESLISDLKDIPGIGAKMERHMQNIGIRCVADLKGRDPEELSTVLTVGKQIVFNRGRYGSHESYLPLFGVNEKCNTYPN